MNDSAVSVPPSKSIHSRLLNRDFLLLWQGQTVSAIGTSLFQIAILYWLMETTGSATIMGLVAMLGAIPGVILGPFGGAIADRFSRKALIVWGDLVLGFAMLSLALPFYLLPPSLPLQIGWVIGVSMLVGVVGAFFRPAVMAALPSLVPMHKLQAANAMNGVSMTASMALGQAAGGILFRVIGGPAIMLVNGVTYLLSALSEIFIHVPQKKPEAVTSLRELGRAFLQDIVVGLRYVWRKEGLRNMMIAFALLNFVTSPLGILMPILLDKWLHLPPDWFGYLMAAMGVGNLIGMSVAGMAKIDGNVRFAAALAALYAMAGVNLVFGLVSSPVILVVANLFAGTFLGVMMVTFTTLMQFTTPDELRGRVSSVMMAVMMGSVPIAMGLAGILADLVDQNIPLLFICAGVLAFIVVTGMAVNGPFRAFLSTQIADSPVAA